jgi:uncharacterized phage-associated protein
MMAHDSRAVANYFLKRADEAGTGLTPMQVIKLVYFAHGWALGLLGIPLISDRVEAWDYGPVIRPVYDQFKRFGNRSIGGYAQHPFPPIGGTEAPRIEANFDPLETELLDRVWDVYGKLTGFQLSDMTHELGTPWQKVHGSRGKNALIEDSIISEYFSELARQNQQKQHR